MKTKSFLAVTLALTILGTLSSQGAYAGGVPAEGTFLQSFNSNTFAVGMAFDGQFFYIPNGISSNSLNIFDINGVPQGVLPLSCTIGNLSFDASRNVFWAGDVLPNVQSPATSVPIWTIDPNTGNCNFEFDALPLMNANGACGVGNTVGGVCQWPFDGIDLDERDDTLRLSPDGTTIIYNFNLDGTFASSFGPINTTPECGFDFSSGIATGIANILYSGTDGCTEVIKFNKDTGAKLGSFTINAARNEAMECDNVTFKASGHDAIWVKDLTGLVQSFVVPAGTCLLIPEVVVGGEILPIDTTALLLAGAQTNAVWIMSALAVIGSIAFGALYITSKRN
ncbi:MAG: hypothetical protein O6761_07255 [Thaumarchaeota archaeon]|nr:hypothetical protein [Nitrososphaerota archaeon]